jgi:hypothetical protein
MAIDLAVDCYQLTRGFPKEEIYGLTADTQSGMFHSRQHS